MPDRSDDPKPQKYRSTGAAIVKKKNPWEGVPDENNRPPILESKYKGTHSQNQSRHGPFVQVKVLGAGTIKEKGRRKEDKDRRRQD